MSRTNVGSFFNFIKTELLSSRICKILKQFKASKLQTDLKDEVLSKHLFQRTHRHGS